MVSKYDLIVVGAGTAGSVTAQSGAKNGYRVCLIDQKKKEQIGDKTCGDAVSVHHFDDLGIPQPKGEELASNVVGIDVFSPDLKTVYKIKGEGLHGFMLNRHTFGKRLLNEAIDCGADLLEQTKVQDPIIKEGCVIGVEVKDLIKNELLEIYGTITIDASGMSSVLRRKMPRDWKIETEIQRKDVEICYREIRKLSRSLEDPEYLRIYLDTKIFPGGYYWVFPKGNNLVNVGLGVQMSYGLNPKRQLYDHALTHPLFANSEIIKSGGGIVSTRRPIDCMVGNGVMFVGDAAYQPNPIHGGGIGPSMIAGKLAANVGCKALEEEDVSRENLWSYNTRYMRGNGATLAQLDIFRKFLQKCDDDNLNYGMANRLVKEEDILHACLGEDLKINVTDKAERFFKGINRISFLKALYETSKRMKEMKKLYTEYPDITGYDSWVQKVKAVNTKMERMKI